MKARRAPPPPQPDPDLITYIEGERASGHTRRDYNVRKGWCPQEPAKPKPPPKPKPKKKDGSDACFCGEVFPHSDPFTDLGHLVLIELRIPGLTEWLARKLARRS